MLVWIDAFYKTHKIYNSKLAEEETGQASKKPVKKLSVTAKKGTKNIKIQTINSIPSIISYAKPDSDF